MANIDSATYTGQAAEELGSRALGTEVYGQVRFLKATFTTDASTAADDVVRIGILPKGAVVIPGLSFIDTEDCGTDISITIGDTDPTADADRYSTAISLATAGVIRFASGVAGPNPHTLTANATIQGVLVDAGSISVTAAKDFTVWVAYRLA